MLFEGGAESIDKFLRPSSEPTCLPQAACETGCDFILALGLRKGSPSSQPQTNSRSFWMPPQAPKALKHLAEGFW